MKISDFDGDAMTFVMMLDNYMSGLIKPLQPHNALTDPGMPRGITNIASIPKPIATCYMNYLRAKDRNADQLNAEGAQFMRELEMQ